MSPHQQAGTHRRGSGVRNPSWTSREEPDPASTSAFLLLSGNQSPRAQNLWLKLLHINATAKLESPDYQGPFLPAETLSPAELGGDRVTLLQSSLREALARVLGSPENGRFNVRTIYGWSIGESVPSATPLGSAWGGGN